MQRLKTRIKQAIALRTKRRKILARSNAREDELLAAIEEFEADLERKRGRLRKLRRQDRRPDKRDVLADEIEDVEAALDVLYERLASCRSHSAKAQQRLNNAQQRVKRLQRRRAEIEASRGDLSPNFSRAEFNCREGGPVPDYMQGSLEDLCDRVLEKMRARFGAARVNSGHRWHFYNLKIGGAPNSYHEYELRKSQPAADCTFATGTPAEWAAYARSLGVGGVGQYSTFCHVDSGPRRDWWG